MLIGIVVTNAIVLLDLVEQHRRRGMPMYEALMQGGRTRVRPILMTAIATMLALSPLALGLSEGEIIASELATVVIGGLFTSTFLTLIVVPVVYSLVEDGKVRTSSHFGRQGEGADTAEPAAS
jgi:HAE1 family hydrophobic/amphiphilic exporter-1